MIKSCITWIIIMNQHRGTKQITYQPACGWDVRLLRGCFQWKPLNWSCCSHGMKKRLWLLSGYVSLFVYFIFASAGSLFLNLGSLQLQWVEVTLHCSAWASQCGGFLLQSTGSRCTGFSVAAHGLRSRGTQPLGLHFWYKEIRMHGLVSLSSFWL